MHDTQPDRDGTTALRTDVRPAARDAALAEKPSVLMIGKYFPPVLGGIEEYVYGLAEALGGRYDLTVLVHSMDSKTHRERHEGYQVVRSATWAKVGSQPLSPGMVLEMLRRRYDIIHFHAPNVLGGLLVLAFARGARIVVTHHNDIVGFGAVGRAAKWLYARLLARTSAMSVLSLKNRDLSDELGGLKAPCFALPHAIDPARFEPTDAIRTRAAALRAEHAPNGETLFAFIGRIVPYKGLDVLVRALPDAPGVKTLVIGDGRERPALEAQAKAAGVGDRLVFLGRLDEDEKHAVLRASDAFVLPSVMTEGFGIVQVEAQLCGLPILATDLPSGVTDVTRHGETGIIVPPGDATALAAALRQLAGDKELRERLGAGGRARALANYVPRAVKQAVFEVYEHVLARR